MDSFVWVEYFHPKHQLDSDIKSIVATTERDALLTPEIIAHELASVYGSSGYSREDFQNDFKIIEALSLRKHLAPRIERNGNKIGWIDCLLIAMCARIDQKNENTPCDLKVLTGDPHFDMIANPSRFGLDLFISNVSQKVGLDLKSRVEFLGKGGRGDR